MLYRVSYWEPDPYAPGYNLVRSWIEGSRKTASVSIGDVLPPVFESSYGSRVNRRPFVQLSPVRRFRSWNMAKAELRECGPTETIEQPVIIVPSVGELGYTP